MRGGVRQMTNHPNRKRASDNTVKLVRRRSGFVNVDDAFRPLEPGYEHAVDEYNEELVEYYLPEGYTVDKTKYGETAIFDPADKYCNIVMHRPTGRPQLVSESREMPVLKRKVAA
jgi:hypothetical protein